jgi:hypothetical protein
MQTQKQLARQAQELSVLEADRLRKKTRFLTAQVTINTSTTPPLLQMQKKCGLV